jgi:hypothetical protein
MKIWVRAVNGLRNDFALGVHLNAPKPRFYVETDYSAYTESLGDAVRCQWMESWVILQGMCVRSTVAVSTIIRPVNTSRFAVRRYR